MKSLEWKWGLIIGAANMVWLLISWRLGWHGGRIGLFQVAITLGFFITLVCFILAFLAITREEPETTFPEGLRSGSIIAALSAGLAALSWFVYLGWINPGMSSHLVAETKNHFAMSGANAGEVELVGSQAEKAFSQSTYTTQAGVGALILGVVFSALIMGLIRWRARR